MANPDHIALLLKGVDAWNSERKRCDFTPDLSSEDLTETFRKAGRLNSNIRRIQLQNVNFRDARLCGTGLKWAVLCDADLRGARLLGVDLTGADLDGADLRGADLTAATLKDADLTNTNVLGADMTRTRPWTAFLYDSSDRMAQIPLRLKSEVQSVSDLLDVHIKLEEYYNRDNRQATRLS